MGASAGDDGDQESILSSSVCIESANGHDSDGELPSTPAISEHSRPSDSTLHGDDGSHFERHLCPSSLGEAPPEVPPLLGNADGYEQQLHLVKGRVHRVSFDDACSSPVASRDPSQNGSQPDTTRQDMARAAGKAPSGSQAKGSPAETLGKAGDQPHAVVAAGDKTAGAGLSVRPRRPAKELHEAAPSSRHQEPAKPEVTGVDIEGSEHGDAADSTRKAMEDAIAQAVMLLDIGPAAGEDTIEHVAKVGIGAAASEHLSCSVEMEKQRKSAAYRTERRAMCSAVFRMSLLPLPQNKANVASWGIIANSLHLTLMMMHYQKSPQMLLASGPSWI